MSERGSFVTEFIHCPHCLSAVLSMLGARDKYLTGAQVPHWRDDGSGLPIVAGKVGGLHPGEELETFELHLLPELAQRVCHPLRLAVLAECGQAFYTVAPGGRVMCNRVQDCLL